MIYVDQLMQHGVPGQYRGALAAQAERVGARNGHQWCHLFSDEIDPTFPELRAFAERIGMKREWFQGDHYDLTPPRRTRAVRAGAKEVDRAQAVAIWRTTPRAQKFRCKRCGHITERSVTPPKSCPDCGATPSL